MSEKFFCVFVDFDGDRLLEGKESGSSRYSGVTALTAGGFLPETSTDNGLIITYMRLTRLQTRYPLEKD